MYRSAPLAIGRALRAGPSARPSAVWIGVGRPRPTLGSMGALRPTGQQPKAASRGIFAPCSLDHHMGPTWFRQRLRSACKHAERWGTALQNDLHALTGEYSYALAA